MVDSRGLQHVVAVQPFDCVSINLSSKGHFGEGVIVYSPSLWTNVMNICIVYISFYPFVTVLRKTTVLNLILRLGYSPLFQRWIRFGWLDRVNIQYIMHNDLIV